ncbi:MAG TPA: hypothetical protein VGE52_08600 [Pirellulales bacterium]
MRSSYSRFGLIGSLWATTSLCTTVALVAPAFAEDERAFRRATAQLLQVGWTAPASARDEAESHYKAAKTASPGDVRADYALALVRMKHSQYRDAVKTLDAALAIAPHDPTLLEARAWLAFALRQPAEGLVLAESWARRLGQRAAAEAGEGSDEATAADAVQPKASPALRRSAESLGRLIGFAEGPGKTDAKRTVTVIEEALPRNLLIDFEDGRTLVADQYSELVQEQGKLTEAIKENQVAGMIHEQERITAERTQIADRVATLKTEEDAAKAALNDKLRLIDEDLQANQQTYASLEGQAQGLRRQVLSLDNQIGELLALADDRNTTPSERADYLYRADRLRLIRSQVAVDLSTLNGSLRGLSATLMQLQNARAQVNSEYNVGRDARTKESGNLKGRLGRLTRDEGRNAASVTGRSTQGRQAASKLETLGTYHPYPIESEHRRLLDELTAP